VSASPALALAQLGGPTGGIDPWRYHAHPEVWAIFTAAAALYVLALVRLGPGRAPEGEPIATRRQVACFLGGVVLLWAVADWPVHDLAERYLYSVHMAQHLVITLVAPPLLLLGMPAWLTRRVLGPRPVAGAVRAVARPLFAGITFNLVFVLSHWPAVVNGTLEHEPLHFLAHLVLFASGLLMWFPVVNRLPEFPSMSPPLRMLYLFLQTVVPTIPASFLTFAQGTVYSFYARVPHTLGLSAIEDQQLAGALMKVGEAALIWSVILVVFFRWCADSERAERAERAGRLAAAAEVVPAGDGGGDDDEVLTWADVQRALEQAGAPPPEPAR
jgi:putative membrane protein